MSSSFLHYSMYFLFSLRFPQVPDVCEKQVFQAAHIFKFFFLFEAHLQFSPPGLIPGFASDSSSYFSLDSRTHCFFWRFKKKIMLQ